MSSPYYPKSLVINGFLPQSIPAEKILLAFGLVLVGLQLLFSILYARGSHKKGSYGVALWFFTCGIIHSFVEGYFVYYNKSIASKDSFMANVWKEYAKSDSRYMTSDATVVMIEAITAYLWGPLCFYTAYLCYKNNQMRHFLQVLIVFGQLYGDIVYYGSTLLTGSIHCHPDPYYFWFYFVFMNSLWIIFPVLILIKSGGEICKAMNQTAKIKKVESLKTRSSPRLSPRRKVDDRINMDLLGGLVKRLESVTSKLESMATGKSGSNTESAHDESKAVAEFMHLMDGPLTNFVTKGSSLDAPIPQVTDLVKQAFVALKELISVASKSAKPNAQALPGLLAPLQGIMGEISGLRDSNRGGPYFSHLSMISEAIPALGWVVVEPAPAPYVGEMKEAGQFYANRVIKDFKETDKRHVEWVSSFVALLSDLQVYVKQHHTTGLVWNPKGTSATASEPAPPRSPSKLAPAVPSKLAPAVPPKGPAPSGNFLKELSGGTSGLRKVDKSEMTHKNPELRATSIVQERDIPEKKAAPAIPSKTPSKPPKLALEGNKWVVENYTNESSIVIDKTEIRHTVYIYNCTNCTVMIKGKVNAVSVDACKKTGVLIDSVVSTIDVINGKSISVQITGKAPTMAVDKTDGLQLYLSKDSLDLELLTAKSSAINFMVPSADGDYVEYAAPEQLKIQFTSEGKKLLASAVEHRG